MQLQPLHCAGPTDHITTLVPFYNLHNLTHFDNMIIFNEKIMCRSKNVFFFNYLIYFQGKLLLEIDALEVVS